MCKQKILENEVCVNTKCPYHMCNDKLRLAHPNLFTEVGWVYQNCLLNVRHSELEQTEIAQMWGVSRQRIQRIESMALAKLKEYHLEKRR